jgi:prolyl-tRNA synthetase
MQDGKALQAATSHFLGSNFARAQNIRFQNDAGELEFAHTTSWGMTTRMIGAAIMVHGDDDGMRVPPRVAPWQIVIVPMLRDVPEDAALLDYCRSLQAELAKLSAFGEPVRALLDIKGAKAATKRWGWVKKGAPVIVEVGGRDMAGGNVTVLRRDQLYKEDGKLNSWTMPRDDLFSIACPFNAVKLLTNIQAGLYEEAKARMEANITRDVIDFAGLEAFFKEGDKQPGWLEINWSKPTGAALDAVTERLKTLKLTLRNVPVGAAPATGACLFTGEPAVERVLVGRAY